MSKVFISYSRDDKAFVLRLHDALAAQEFDVWVDWEDIPSSADWWQEICTGIDAADGFISVISPPYLVSTNCNREIDHAIETRKRVVPIVFRDVKPADVRHEISALNWIFVRESDDFASAVQALIHTLQTDLDYVRAHTRLLVRSLEWEQKQRNTSFLLRGNDLREAEGWLAQPVEKQPLPTPLQIQYIAASRRAATARQRVIVGALTLGLLIAIILTIVAIVNGNRAQNNFLASETHRLAIAASAALQSDDFDLATLLGIRALRTAYSEDANLVLNRAIAQTAGMAFRGHSGRILTVAYSPEGQYALTGSSDGTARLWQLATGQEVRRFVTEGDATAVTFSPDGHSVLTGDAGGAVQLWDIESGTKIRDFPGHSSAVLAVAFSPDGRYVLTGGDDRTARLWDAATGAQIRTFDSRPDNVASITSVVFSGDGHYALTARGYNVDQYDGSAHVWDVETGQMLRELPGQGSALRSVAFSPQGFASVALTSGEDGKARLWNWDTEQVTQVFSGNQQSYINATISPDGQFVLTAGDGILWKADTGAVLRRLTEDGLPVEHAAFSPDGRYVFGSIGDHARLWDLQTGPELRRVTSSAASGLQASFAPDGQTILTVEADHVVRLIDTATNQEKMRFPSSTAVDARFSSDGRFVYTSGAAVERWDIANGELSASLNNIPSFLQQYTLSPEGRYMLLLEGGPMKAVELWSLDTQQLIRLFDNRHFSASFDSHTVGDTNAIAYMPDGRAIATGNLYGVITLWDVVSGGEIRRFGAGTGAAVTALAVSADGQRIASGDDDGSGHLWDVATGQELVRLIGHQSWVTSAAFSPDGRSLLTASGGDSSLSGGSGDDTMRLWDANTGAELQIFTDAQAADNSIAFSPDGRYALTTGLDGSVRLWQIGHDPLIALACSRIDHDLSAAQRTTYGVDESPTCPAFGVPIPLEVNASSAATPASLPSITELSPLPSSSITPAEVTSQPTATELPSVAASATPSLIPAIIQLDPVAPRQPLSFVPVATPTSVGFG